MSLAVSFLSKNVWPLVYPTFQINLRSLNEAIRRSGFTLTGLQMWNVKSLWWTPLSIMRCRCFHLLLMVRQTHHHHHHHIYSII